MAADCPRLFEGQRDVKIDHLVFLKREKSDRNLNNVTQSGLDGGGKQLT